MADPRTGPPTFCSVCSNTQLFPASFSLNSSSGARFYCGNCKSLYGDNQRLLHSPGADIARSPYWMREARALGPPDLSKRLPRDRSPFAGRGNQQVAALNYMQQLRGENRTFSGLPTPRVFWTLNDFQPKVDAGKEAADRASKQYPYQAGQVW